MYTQKGKTGIKCVRSDRVFYARYGNERYTFLMSYQSDIFSKPSPNDSKQP
jgi:hypothetical protein